MAATATETHGVARVDILGPGAGSVCEQIPDYETVTDLTVFETAENARSVQIETTVPVLMQSLQDSGVPLDMPVEIRDGELTLAATVPQESLSDLGETLDEFGIGYTVEWIRQDVESASLLTDRQRWLLEEAIDRPDRTQNGFSGRRSPIRRSVYTESRRRRSDSSVMVVSLFSALEASDCVLRRTGTNSAVV